MSSYSFVFYNPLQVERLDLGRQIDSIALPNLWEAGCQDLCTSVIWVPITAEATFFDRGIYNLLNSQNVHNDVIAYQHLS